MPTRLLPTPSESIYLTRFISDLDRTPGESNDRIPQTFGEVDELPIRQRRQDALSFEEHAVLVALQNDNACNPVLRASANSIIEEMQMYEYV